MSVRAVLEEAGLTLVLGTEYVDVTIHVSPRKLITPVLANIIREHREELITDLEGDRVDTLWPAVPNDRFTTRAAMHKQQQSGKPASSDITVRILASLRTGPHTMAELSTILDVSVSAVRSVLEPLMRHGTIRYIHRNQMMGDIYSTRQ